MLDSTLMLVGIRWINLRPIFSTLDYTSKVSPDQCGGLLSVQPCTTLLENGRIFTITTSKCAMYIFKKLKFLVLKTKQSMINRLSAGVKCSMD